VFSIILNKGYLGWENSRKPGVSGEKAFCREGLIISQTSLNIEKEPMRIGGV